MTIPPKDQVHRMLQEHLVELQAEAERCGEQIISLQKLHRQTQTQIKGLKMFLAENIEELHNA